MTNFFSWVLRAADTAAESTEAATEYVPVVTEYSTTTVPVSTLILTGVSFVILIAAAVLAFIYLKNRAGFTWTHSLLYGLLGGFVSTFLLPNVVYFVFGLIPTLTPLLDSNPEIPGGIVLAVQALGGAAAVIVGMILLEKALAKRHMQLDLGSAFVFGVSFYGAMILMNGQVSYSFEFLTYASTLNSQGFDSMVNAYLQATQGATVEEAIDLVMKTFVEMDALALVMSAVQIVAQGISYICMSVVMYGVLTKKLDRMCILFVVFAPIVFFLPQIINLFIPLEGWMVFAGNMVAMGIEAAFCVFVIKNFLTDDWEKFNEKKPASEMEVQRNTPPKMPKIVMPKITDDVIPEIASDVEGDVVTPEIVSDVVTPELEGEKEGNWNA